MTTTRRFILLATVALAAMCCGAAVAADKKLVIGFAQTGAESEWRTANTDSVKAAAVAAGYELKFSDGQQK